MHNNITNGITYVILLSLRKQAIYLSTRPPLLGRHQESEGTYGEQKKQPQIRVPTALIILGFFDNDKFVLIFFAVY
jgi:hypothetical protein